MFYKREKPSFIKDVLITSLVLVCYLLFYILPEYSYAGAWVQNRGEGLIITTVQPYFSCKYWDKQGHLHRGPCFKQLAVAPYIEYGATDKITLIVAPLLRSFRQANESSAFDIKNISIGARMQLWKSDWSVLSTQLLYNQPLRSPVFSTTLNLYTSNLIKRPYLDMRLLYGTGSTFDAAQCNTWYAEIESAYRHFFAKDPDEFHVDFGGGLKTDYGRLVLGFQAFTTISLYDPNQWTAQSYNLFSLAPSLLYWWFPNVGVQIGIQQDIYGTNTGRGTAPFAALWIKF